MIVGAVLGTACSGTDRGVGPTQPTDFNSGSAVSVQATPPTAFAEPVDHSICPMVSPFQVRFNLLVQPIAPGGVVVVNGVTLQFTDGSGIRMPMVTLPAPLPTAQFGTALDQARGVLIPVNLGVGCGTGRRGTVRVTVDTRDASGRSRTAMTTVRVD